MITKSIWHDCLFDIKLHKTHHSIYNNSDYLGLFVALCILPFLSVILILMDLLLLPFEIGFYFFKKWIKS